MIWSEVGAKMAPTKGEIVSVKPRGELAFESAYADWFGARWEKLRPALDEAVQKVGLVNPFRLDSQPGNRLDWSSLIESSVLNEKLSNLNVDLCPAGSGREYELDLASVFAALALPVPAGGRFLDLCSAPGGKALAIIYRARGQMDISLNELSNDRLQRLKAVCYDHLEEAVRTKIRFTKRDGSRWPISEGPYDAILVDAPCSGERHLLSRPKELATWTLTRSKGLAIRQHALLCSALEVTSPSGYILYSTCALSPLENDHVVEKFLKKRKGRVKVEEAPLWIGERTQFGVQIFPDQNPGFGPIYYSLLRRISSSEQFDD